MKIYVVHFVLFLSFLSLMFSKEGHSQNYIKYYGLVNKAEYEFYNGNYQRALILFDKAFKKCSPLAIDYFLKARCLSEIKKGDIQEIERLLILSAKNNGLTTMWLNRNPFDFKIKDSVLQQIQWLEDSCDKEIAVIKDSLNSFRKKDQMFRNLSNLDEVQNNQIASKERIRLEKENIQLQKEFLEFVKRNRYCGVRNAKTNLAQTILLHIDCELFPSYKKELKNQLKSGDVQPFVYAQMIDRISCICKSKSYYLAYPLKDCEVELERAKKNRKSIGLSTYFKHSRFTRERTNERMLLKSD